MGGIRAEIEERIERRERVALRNKLKPEKHTEIYRGLKGVYHRDENILARPNGLRENAETAISCG